MSSQQNSGLFQKSFGTQIADEYSTIFGKTSMGAFCYLPDEDLSILWANDSFYRQSGLIEEEFTSRFQTLKQYYIGFPDDFKNIKEKVHKTLKQGKTGFTITARFPLENGAVSWMRISSTVTEQIAAGYPVCYAILKDITDFVRQAEKQKRSNEEAYQYFQWMMDEYTGNIYISDIETYELLYVNKTALNVLTELMQLSESEIIGRKCYEVIQGRTSPCPFCTNDRITENEFYEWEFDNPNLGRTFMIKNRVVNWCGRRARLELSHDMLSAEYRLAKKDQERDAIIRTIPGGFARIDARDMRTVLWYGGGFLDMIGYTQEQFENELLSKCNYVHPDDLERAVEVMRSSQATGVDTVAEGRIVTRGGEIKILTMTFSYVSGEESWDGIPSFYSVGIDITKEREEQARQREALEDAYKAARVASSAKTNFLSSMSHDIRTPMNAIMGMTTIAEANLDSPEKISNCLSKIESSSRHLLNLINEVLDMSKIESGKIDLILGNIDLSELIQSIVDICHPLIAEKEQEFQISVGEVKHEKVVTDGDRLRQVIMNILTNAIKYTPKGGRISLRINELNSVIPNEGQYEFIFSDNGVGMSDEYIKHIFEPFSRAEDSMTSRIQGTGLGMAITDNIVRMMNGTIEIKSRLGEGSQFTVSIPLELQDEEKEETLSLAGRSVLIVDDDRIACESTSTLLNELGIQSHWAMSGIEAIDCITRAHGQGEDFFAILVDWKMPEMDGLEIVKCIRQKIDKWIPVIVISAYDYSNIEKEFLHGGADLFITKPLFRSKMLHALKSFLTDNNVELSRSAAIKRFTDFSGKRVLLVEDNELNREIAIELLKMQTLNIDLAEDGQEALAMFKASEPGEYAAILMDIQMPVMNGYDAAAAIRTLERKDARTIPILAMTANAFVSDIGKARNAGMNDHIAKPIDIKVLVETLQKWIV